MEVFSTEKVPHDKKPIHYNQELNL